jgi:hypothetical protein
MREALLVPRSKIGAFRVFWADSFGSIGVEVDKVMPGGAQKLGRRSGFAFT